MAIRFGALRAHWPAALLLLMSGWTGTFYGAAEGWRALLGHLALLAFVALWGSVTPDPLRLGRAGGWLLAAFGVSLLASWAASPVPRAGWTGVVLLPAFLFLPRAVEGCWATVEERRAGLLSISLVVAGLAGASLAAWWRFATPGASLPLGHHNFLAAWLVTLLPLSLVPWSVGGPGRWAASAAGVLGLAAFLATRSFTGAMAFGLAVILGAGRGRKARWLAWAAVFVVASQLPRFLQIAAGSDVSARARLAYLEAGLRGLGQRPALGWGPGASSWTLGEHLSPIPGVHPPDQGVADLHSLPLRLAYELGLSGLLLLVALAGFAVRRWLAPAGPADPALRRAAGIGLIAFATLGLAGRSLAIPALPVAAAIVLGAFFAGGAPRPREAKRWPAMLVAAVLAALVIPVDLGQMSYDRAAAAEHRDERIRHLRGAVRLDPSFSLYRARLAWLEAESGAPGASSRALAAARDAGGVAPLWLAAGILGQESGDPWAEEALLRACRSSPMGAVAPWRLALGSGAPELRAEWAARALLAEPGLLAATGWEGRGELLEAAVDRVSGLEGLDPAWRRKLRRLSVSREHAEVGVRRLALEMDTSEAVSTSLHVFRRRPWPHRLAEIEVSSKAFAAVDLVAATRLSSTDRRIFQDEHCGLGKVVKTQRDAPKRVP